jgi:hypothetical protein
MIKIGADVRLTPECAMELDEACCWTPRGMLLTNSVESFTAKVVEVLGDAVLVRDPSGTIWNFRSEELVIE